MKKNDTDAALTDIIGTWTSPLREYIRRRVGDDDDAEDILQEVFYQLVRNSRMPDNEISRVSAWLFRVARNSILNLWRRKRELPMPDDGNGIDEFADMLFSRPESTPEQTYLRKLVWEEMEDALAQLPPEQSEVFCLTVFDGIPVKEISANTGVPVATLLSRKHYAVKYLRLRLRGLYEDILSY
jgi:RNA polymerase sigma factor (sigma-70 family)